MNFHETIWLEQCPLEFKPKFYRRYVDDIIVLFETLEQFETFKDYLNAKHNNINFTREIEIDGRLPFLDILIDRNNGDITTSVYRKPTFTGVYTHFHSFLPSCYKFGLMSTILFRYFSICSSYCLFHLEVVEFKKIFLRNGYPLKLIDTCIQRFLNRTFVKKVLVDNVPRRKYSIVLPYLGPLSQKIQRRLKKVFQKLIPTGEINIVYKTQRRLSHLLRFKDVVPSDLDSHLIYHFKCPSCNAGYVGETRVPHIVRNCQHLGISPYTEKPMKGGVPTSVTKHIIAKKCKCSLENFSILGRESDYHKRLIKESLFIKLYNYELNGQETSTEIFLF